MDGQINLKCFINNKTSHNCQHCVTLTVSCLHHVTATLSPSRCHIVFACRKITVHDTNPDLFRVFLAYLYSGQLKSELTVEQLADMMTLSDHYEVSGRQHC